MKITLRDSRNENEAFYYLRRQKHWKFLIKDMWRGKEKREALWKFFTGKNVVIFATNTTSTHVIHFQETVLSGEWNKRAGAQPDLPSLSGKISTWWQVFNAPTGLAITRSTSCLLPTTQEAKAFPLLMTFWQEDLGRDLERLNSPFVLQSVQQPPASLGWAGHPCHQEGNCVCHGHG